MAKSKYARQEAVPEIGKSGQEKLSRSSVTIIGLGGLGTVTSEILARGGVGNMILIDDDIVKPKDLHRQILYNESDLGKPKATVAAERLQAMNGEVNVKPVVADANAKTISKIIGKPDVVLDCTDNIYARSVINAYCLKHKLPWVHAAAVGTCAEMMVFDFRKKQQPCYSCICGKSNEKENRAIISTTTFPIAAMQAAETIKLLLGEKTSSGLLKLDGWKHSITKLSVRQKKHCESCNMGHCPIKPVNAKKAKNS